MKLLVILFFVASVTVLATEGAPTTTTTSSDEDDDTFEEGTSERDPMSVAGPQAAFQQGMGGLSSSSLGGMVPNPPPMMPPQNNGNGQALTNPGGSMQMPGQNLLGGTGAPGNSAWQSMNSGPGAASNPSPLGQGLSGFQNGNNQPPNNGFNSQPAVGRPPNMQQQQQPSGAAQNSFPTPFGSSNGQFGGSMQQRPDSFPGGTQFSSGSPNNNQFPGSSTNPGSVSQYPYNTGMTSSGFNNPYNNPYSMYGQRPSFSPFQPHGSFGQGAGGFNQPSQMFPGRGSGAGFGGNGFSSQPPAWMQQPGPF